MADIKNSPTKKTRFYSVLLDRIRQPKRMRDDCRVVGERVRHAAREVWCHAPPMGPTSLPRFGRRVDSVAT